MKHVFNPGLYAITPQCYPTLNLVTGEVRLALKGGATMVQFRDKSNDDSWRLELALTLKQVCHEFEAPLIINDDAELAVACEAAGVHVGRDDIPVSQAREMLGPDAIIGVSCYNSLSLAEAAVSDGADYLAFGSFYPSESKPEAIHCPLEVLGEAAKLGLPIVAIGGITLDNGRALIEAGANSLAVITAIFGAPDIRAASRAFSKMWEE